MLKKRHVLVLGAGASQPFGLPTGIELSQLMTTRLIQGNAAFKSLTDLGIEPGHINFFRDAFFRSGKNSVDAFLEHRPDLMTLGKLATAAVLIPYEQES